MNADLTESKPWLTVIMPSYKGEQWIEAALRSLEAQSAGVEILLIDSSPTSATIDIARTHADRLQLKIFARPDLTSWQAKTNFGVEASRSSHICWLGVDDVWLPGRAKAIQEWIESAPQAPLHLGPSAIIDRNAGRVGVWRCPLPANMALTPGFVTERLLVQNFVGAPAPVFRKDAWIACGGLDEGLWYTADWDIWLKLAASGVVWYHDDLTIAFRIHGSSLTMSGSRNNSDFERQMQIVVDRHIGKFKWMSASVARAARASIAVNAALASASGGDLKGLPKAIFAVILLGPSCAYRYLRDSRILERAIPRLRARLSGTF